MATAGPESVLATSPVSTKMPVPMMTPTPKTVRSSAERCLRSWCSGSSVSRMESSTDLIRRWPAATASLHSWDGDRLFRNAGRVTATYAALRRGGPMSTIDSQGTPPVAKLGLTPSTRPRPAGPSRRHQVSRQTDTPIMDCAVYVDGRRQPGASPDNALTQARELGGFVWLGLFEPT